MGIKKLLRISSGEKEIEALENWVVKWVTYKHIDYGTPHYQVFTSEEKAKEFRASIHAAQKLLGIYPDSEIYKTKD